ncbi:hypothetical protein JCM5353_008132 [Sporobolomyces roseus]
MNSRAAPPPSSQPLLSSSLQPIYTPNLQHNQKSLYYVKSTTSCIAGATAGILGLTNFIGFAFFFISTITVGVAFGALKCKGTSNKFFLGKAQVVTSGLAEGLFSYVLFWTLFYSLVYIYD